MKANELMLGDWVYIEDGEAPDGLSIVKVVCLAGDNTEWLHPIPLTAEILEKNGFRYEHNYGQYYRSILGDYAKDKEPTISIGWNSKGEMCEWDIADGKRGASYGRHLLGVHELQHALRLCGLTELADNFKVE